jgi:hypothetical protein
VVGSDDVALGGAPTAAFDNKNVGTNKPVTVTGYALVGAGIGNYTLSQPAGLAANITPLALTTTGLSALNKTYDGSTTATLSGTAGLGGVLGGDVVSVDGKASGAFTDANVGTGKTVNVTGLSLAGADAGNYSLTPLELTADITPASTTTVLISSANPSIETSNVTFTATVTPVAPATMTPAGSVQFYTNGVTCGGSTPLSVGAASITLETLPIGYTTVHAAYLPDGNFLSSFGDLDQLVHAILQTPITVSIENDGGQSVTVSFSGTPYAVYVLQASSNLAAPAWENVATNAAGADGKWTFEDTTGGRAQRFYRAAKP